ncbi:MAG: hypothetical protein HQL69_10980 [Magnetococcales bacterium]|nr:hypothetical protein [Magnetococcales bacterium]
MENHDPQMVITACGRQLLHSSNLSISEFSVCDENMAGRCSPELHALTLLYQGAWENHLDKHTLLFSDTPEDRSATECIAAWLRHKGQFVELLPLSGLEKGESNALDLGIKQFAHWCGTSLTNYRLHEFQIIFNPAGGSHLLTAILQTLAPFYATESIYMLEDGSKLTHLSLPGIVAKGGALVDRHLTLLRRASVELPQIEDKLPNRLFGPDGLTFFGELLWDHNWREIYGDNILEPISQEVKYSPTFIEQVTDLERDRKILVNERIDQICAYLESKGEMNNPVLGFKEIELEKRIPPATHNCHGWVDSSLWRLEGHFDDDIFILDRVTN